MHSQSDTQKNQKTGLPPMKLYLMDMDEATKHESSQIQSHPASPSWPFSMPVIGKSESGKTNILANLFLGNKAECIYEGKKGGSRYIACDDLIVCGYHPNEPKWAFVRKIYGIISKDPKASYYENIRFSYISPEKIPSVRAFSPERSTAIIFEDISQVERRQIGQQSVTNRLPNWRPIGALLYLKPKLKIKGGNRVEMAEIEEAKKGSK